MSPFFIYFRLLIILIPGPYYIKMKKILLVLAIASIAFASCKKGNGPIVQKAIDSLKVGLIAYYPFNNSGVDSSGNHFDGTVYNVTSTTDRYGKANGAYYFNGENSYVTVQDEPQLRLNGIDFTLNSWVKIDAYNNSYGSIIMAKRGTGSNDGWNFGIAGYGDLTNYVGALGVVTYSISGGDDPYLKGNIVLDTTKWHMVTTVYTVATKQAKIYVDGSLDATSTTDSLSSPNNNSTAPLYIGADFVTGSYFLKGKLDDLRIYDRALSSKEVFALYVLPN